jgi:hypothetical protein
MNILTSGSVDRIKLIFKENPEVLKEPFDYIVNEHKLDLIEHYELDDGIKLVFSDGKKDEGNDYTNANLINQALPDLSPAEATDERLWVTLCLNQYKGYVIARWPKIGNGKHFFCEGFRGLTRENAIARLWWCNYIAKKMKSSTKVRKEFFNDTDRRQQVIERPTSANSKKVLKIIFEILTEQNASGKKYHRDNWRTFAKKINFIGKRKSLPSLEEKYLKEILEVEYLES